MSAIHIMQTGGTIDKDYLATENNHGENFVINVLAARRILKRVGIRSRVTFSSICKKDSLHMTDDDRLLIVGAVTKAREDKIIITHGTDTIKLTAEALFMIPKTIILIGAMRPERFRDSDADFNLGMAFGAIQHLPFGVYIALNGRVTNVNTYKR